MFVFRNNTIERFFPKEYRFSGYDDISFIPEDEDGYVWFYQAPIGYDSSALLEEIIADLQKFMMVLETVNPNKTIIAFTMAALYSLSYGNESSIVGRVSGMVCQEIGPKCLKTQNMPRFGLGQYTLGWHFGRRWPRWHQNRWRLSGQSFSLFPKRFA